MSILSLEKKVESVEKNPTPLKIENLCWIRYDISDVECEAVNKQDGLRIGSHKYNVFEKIIDRCNALYVKIEDLENRESVKEQQEQFGIAYQKVYNN